MKIILVAPKQETFIHIIDIFDKNSVKKINEFIRLKSAEYGRVDRILIQNGETRVMDPAEDIPLPFVPSKRG